MNRLAFKNLKRECKAQIFKVQMYKYFYWYNSNPEKIKLQVKLSWSFSCMVINEPSIIFALFSVK